MLMVPCSHFALSCGTYVCKVIDSPISEVHIILPIPSQVSSASVKLYIGTMEIAPVKVGNSSLFAK